VESRNAELIARIDSLIATAAGCGYHGSEPVGDPFVEEDKKSLLEYIRWTYGDPD
jgi:hypothetical protein